MRKIDFKLLRKLSIGVAKSHIGVAIAFSVVRLVFWPITPGSLIFVFTQLLFYLIAGVFWILEVTDPERDVC